MKQEVTFIIHYHLFPFQIPLLDSNQICKAPNSVAVEDIELTISHNCKYFLFDSSIQVFSISNYLNKLFYPKNSKILELSSPNKRNNRIFIKGCTEKRKRRIGDSKSICFTVCFTK